MNTLDASDMENPVCGGCKARLDKFWVKEWIASPRSIRCRKCCKIFDDCIIGNIAYDVGTCPHCEREFPLSNAQAKKKSETSIFYCSSRCAFITIGHNNRKLSEDQSMALRDKNNKGETISDLSSEYNISKDTVRRYLNLSKD